MEVKRETREEMKARYGERYQNKWNTWLGLLDNETSDTFNGGIRKDKSNDL